MSCTILPPRTRGRRAGTMFIDQKEGSGGRDAIGASGAHLASLVLTTQLTAPSRAERRSRSRSSSQSLLTAAPLDSLNILVVITTRHILFCY